MRLRVAGQQFVVDAPHVAFVSAIVGFCTWYLFDARIASTNVQNLLLVEPAAIVVLVLYVVTLRDAVTVERLGSPRPSVSPREQLTPHFRRRIFGAMALLGLYVLTMAAIGFDLATFLYVLATLRLLGERRLTVLLLVPLLFCAIVIYAFGTLLSLPVPLLLDHLR
jgi:putative tricarboxylic transport membrane protein